LEPPLFAIRGDPASEIDHIINMVPASLTGDSGDDGAEFGQDGGGGFVGRVGRHNSPFFTPSRVVLVGWLVGCVFLASLEMAEFCRFLGVNWRKGRDSNPR